MKSARWPCGTAEGYRTWASIEPVIDFNTSARMIQRALSSGCQHLKIGLMASRTRVATSHYRKLYGDFIQRDLNLFIDEVQQLNRGHNVPIYWKQSVQDLADRGLSSLPNAVGKEWSMFNNE